MTEVTDEPIDDDPVADRRDRARVMLGKIAEQAKQALAEPNIDISLFFLIPSSGNTIVTIGTPDPTDHEWHRVGEIVAAIVAQSIGADRLRCREVTCARTHDHPHAGAVR